MISLSRLAANTQVGRNDKEKLRRDLAKPETSGLSLLRRGRRLEYRWEFRQIRFHEWEARLCLSGGGGSEVRVDIFLDRINFENWTSPLIKKINQPVRSLLTLTLRGEGKDLLVNRMREREREREIWRKGLAREALNSGNPLREKANSDFQRIERGNVLLLRFSVDTSGYAASKIGIKKEVRSALAIRVPFGVVFPLLNR